jgi:hypothetical protein
MKHRLILASASMLALAAALVPGCGDSGDDPGGAAGSGSPPGGAAGAASQVAAAGTGGAAPGAAGSSAATPGTGGSEGTPVVQPPGSAGSTGANNGAAQGGSGGAAGAGGAPAAMGDPSALCVAATPSPADGVACTVTCTDPCGIHNLGTRLCTCASAVFDCASCAYAMPHPLLTPPGTPLSACTLSDDAQEDATGCTENERCQSIGRTPGAADGTNRFCGCLAGKWDCDTKPMGF